MIAGFLSTRTIGVRQYRDDLTRALGDSCSVNTTSVLDAAINGDVDSQSCNLDISDIKRLKLIMQEIKELNEWADRLLAEKIEEKKSAIADEIAGLEGQIGMINEAITALGELNASLNALIGIDPPPPVVDQDDPPPPPPANTVEKSTHTMFFKSGSTPNTNPSMSYSQGLDTLILALNQDGVKTLTLTAYCDGGTPEGNKKAADDRIKKVKKDLAAAGLSEGSDYTLKLNSHVYPENGGAYEDTVVIKNSALGMDWLAEDEEKIVTKFISDISLRKVVAVVTPL